MSKINRVGTNKIKGRLPRKILYFFLGELFVKEPSLEYDQWSIVVEILETYEVLQIVPRKLNLLLLKACTIFVEKALL